MAIRHWFGSIRFLIITSALGVSLLVAAAMYWATADVFDRAVRQSATEMSASLADGTFNAMYQIMRQGWTRAQLNEFLATIRTQANNEGARIELYRGSRVIAQYGPIEQPNPDQGVLAAFKTGQAQVQMAAGLVRYDRPLIAETQCLACHTNAQAGNVLGVLSIAQPVATLTARAHEQLWQRMLWIMPIPLLTALLIALLLSGRMGRSLQSLKMAIARIERVEDLSTLRFADAKLGFTELDGVLAAADQFADRVRHLAVDRNLLEFEIHLLERFVITSDVVRDWRRYVCNLLREINTVIEVHGVFAAFAVGERPAGVELFWFDPPDESVAASISQRVRQTISTSLGVSLAALVPRQHSIDKQSNRRLSDPASIDLRIKKIEIDTPALRGVVGVIVPHSALAEPVAQLVIESILSTMLNVIGSVRAIEKHTEDLEFYATRDPLTHLYNQRMFWSLLDYEVGRAARHGYAFAVLVIDMDNFKSINDTHGHAFGDQFLRQVAESLQDSLRSGDILARYGGDEFAAILPEAGEKESIMVTERLLAKLRRFRLRAPDGSTVGASLSVGIAMGLQHAETARGLFAIADAQMYRAKQNGKNGFAFPESDAPLDDLPHPVIEEQALLAALHDGGLEIDFQPIFHIENAPGDPAEELLLHRVGVEVFARIMIGKRRLVAQDFIGLLERKGVIAEFDLAIADLLLQKEPMQHGDGLLFINISPRTVRQGRYLSDIAQRVDTLGIARHRLVFELNERESLADLHLFDHFVEELHNFGFKFAIDDASSGHWVFQHLRRYTVDFIKLDANWLANRERIDRDRAFIDSLLGLARTLSVTIIAHRIETPKELAAIRAAGITWVQGHWFDQPRPAPDSIPPSQSPSTPPEPIL
ncbi:diguanylate cyclase [Halothiobacillus sp. DCM-1]|uniref:diguanylate cyclase n=1 Tax=Halothiobacillus sp. DCM-1 TaxID=3112558 RepID=UPI003253F7AC